ncbi:MAG TPA: hypothetical protein VF339_13995 [Gammaproteobacteria bacterium]
MSRPSRRPAFILPSPQAVQGEFGRLAFVILPGVQSAIDELK